jgi:hypothetical protein
MAKKTATDINSFAAQHKLQKPPIDTDGQPVIFGRHGQLYQFDDQRLGVTYSNAINGGAKFKDKTTQRNNRAQAGCLAVGMRLEQQGDLESAFSFDPRDARQAKVAIQTAGVKAKRQVSEATRVAGAARLANWRSQHQASISPA